MSDYDNRNQRLDRNGHARPARNNHRLARWEHDQPAELPWPLAIAIAGIVLVVLFGQFGG